MQARTFSLSITAALFLIVASASFAFAQSSDELHATIRAAILSDPRSQGLSSDQIEIMVDLLSQEAEREGLTARDILWRPDTSSGEVYADAQEACNADSILCRLNMAFGFAGDDNTIPIWLGITSALLLLLIGSMAELHRKGVV